MIVFQGFLTLYDAACGTKMPILIVLILGQVNQVLKEISNLKLNITFLK